MKQKPRQTVKTTIRRRVRHHARMAVVPHSRNKYRPHLIRWQVLTVVLAFMLSLQFAYSSWESGTILGSQADITSQQLLDLTNQARHENGQSELTLDSQLAQAAHAKAHDMFARQYWSHTAPDGGTPWEFIEQSGYRYAVAGENLAKNFVSTGGIVTAWMNSPEHRENLLSDRYQNVGFAVVPGELDGVETTLVVALYGSPSSGMLVSMQPAVLAAQGTQSPAAHFGVALQSLNPVVLTTMALCLVLAVVALVAHGYRHHLSKDRRSGWKRHHGLYKALGIFSIMLAIVTIYGGGQI